jgi:hypothetical protein
VTTLRAKRPDTDPYRTRCPNCEEWETEAAAANERWRWWARTGNNMVHVWGVTMLVLTVVGALLVWRW